MDRDGFRQSNPNLSDAVAVGVLRRGTLWWVAGFGTHYLEVTISLASAFFTAPSKPDFVLRMAPIPTLQQATKSQRRSVYVEKHFWLSSTWQTTITTPT